MEIKHPHCLVDINSEIPFIWEGKAYRGYQGDSLASALIRNDIKLVGRSFKYGRPRGILSAGVEEPNAIATLEKQGFQYPNAKATDTELYPNMEAKSATGIPSLLFDFRAFLRLIHRFMPAGFYYKTFMWPMKWWHWYEKNIRQFTGLSSMTNDLDAEKYNHQYHHCDVCVVGAGIAGMTLAVELAQSGSQVILIDERTRLGGELLNEFVIDQAAADTYRQLVSAVEGSSNILYLSRSTAYALHDYNLLEALEKCQDHISTNARDKTRSRQKIHSIRAQKIALCTGAHERTLMFENNDLPNIMLAGGVRRYLNEYGVISASIDDNIVIYGNNDSIYNLAADLITLKVSTRGIHLIDSRSAPHSTEVAHILKTLEQNNDSLDTKLIIYQGARVIAASGMQQIHGLTIEDASGTTTSLRCQLLAVSGGFSPVVHLDCHTGSKPSYNEPLRAFLPAINKSNRWAAGSIKGFSNWQDCQQDAATQAQAIISGTQTAVVPADNHANCDDFDIPTNAPHAFVDFQNDVKVSDIELAVRENYRSIEHIKRYTALGFGTDQGKTSNINGIAVAAHAMNLPMDEVGTTTFRPAYTPVTFGALAGMETGDFFDIQRYTPMQSSHVAQKAEFELVGQWYRPWYFPQSNESMEQALKRECLAARQGLAIMDASTLGKIDIQGKDAREFLSRIYTNSWAKLAVGQCRYGIMCDEKGMVIDDGVTCCLDENHFLMFTTTGGAASVYATLEMWLQTEWTDLDVYLTSVTDHLSTIGLVGPKSRTALSKLFPDMDFSAEAFKFMHWKSAEIDNIPVKIMRISFSGELAYEINVQSNYARYIWELLFTLGQEYNITPYGTEAMHVLRAEKGFIIVGQDTDGSVTPYDAGLGWAVKMDKPFSFIGKRSLELAELKRKDRKQLVGLRTKDPQQLLPEGAQLVETASSTQLIGHVTSSYMSPILGHSIAMALVVSGHARQNDELSRTIYCKPLSGETIEVEVTDANFYQTNSNQ